MSIMNFDEYYDEWLDDHDYKDSSAVKGWLKISYYICKHVFLPLKFTPLRIDFLSIILSLFIAVIFSIFPYVNEFGLFMSGLLIAFLLIIIGMMDNLDGILARLTNKRSPRGSYQDLLFDRINDGIIIISPIFSYYTQLSSILLLLFTVFLFENLRSIHISVGIPIFSTVSERHARLIFQIGYIYISSCGFYLTSIGFTPQIQIFGKILYFWPNLDILYICLGLISIIGIVELMLKIVKTRISPLEISFYTKSLANTGEHELNEKNKPPEEINRNGFQKVYNNLITTTYFYENKYNIKRLSYFQGKLLDRIIKNPKILFLVSLITAFIFFLLLLLKLNLKSSNLIIEILFGVIIITYFLFIIGNLKRFLYHSAYTRYLLIHYLIFFYLVDLITEILLLSILAFIIPYNSSQIYVIMCLIILLCHTANIINQRRKVRESKTYLSRTIFIIINLFVIIGILFNFIIQNLYVLISPTLLISLLFIRNVCKTNYLL